MFAFAQVSSVYYELSISHQGTKVLSLKHNNQGALKWRSIILRFASCTPQLLKLSWNGFLAWLLQWLRIISVASSLVQCLLMNDMVVSHEMKSDSLTFHRKTSSPGCIRTEAGNERGKRSLRLLCVCHNQPAHICRVLAVHRVLPHNSSGLGKGQVRGEGSCSWQTEETGTLRTAEGRSPAELMLLRTWLLAKKEGASWSRGQPWAASGEGERDGKRNLKCGSRTAYGHLLGQVGCSPLFRSGGDFSLQLPMDGSCWGPPSQWCWLQRKWWKVRNQLRQMLCLQSL